MKLANIYIIFIAIFLLLHCKPKEEGIAILPGRWRMAGIASTNGIIFAVKPSTEKEDVILELPVDALVDIKTPFAGTTPSNTFQGEIGKYNKQDIKIEKFSATYIAESFWGRQFMSRVRQIIGYDIVKDKLYFRLEYEQGHIVFEKIR